MKRMKFKSYVLLACTAIFAISCTDLEIEEVDSLITPTNPDGTTFNGVSDVASALDGTYNAIGNNYGNQENEFALGVVTTDEFLIPTRGTDWGDNGLWRVLHQHAWNSQHQFVQNAWNGWNTTQLQATEIIDPKSNATPAQIAEAKFLRALSQFHILDMWGKVPVRDLSLPPSVLPEVLDGPTVVELIIQDLNDAIAGLPTVGPGSFESTRKASKATARHLLAKVLLNKHVYNGSGTPSSADMAQVVSLVDAIAADGFALQEGFFDIFRIEPDSETIYSIRNDTGPRIFNTLHYTQAFEQGGGWNGFSTLAEFYDLFEGDPNENLGTVDGTPLSGQEERRGYVPPRGLPAGAPGTKDDNGDGFADGSNVGFGFLIGQQYDIDGTPLEDRSGSNLLKFSRDFVDGTGAKNLQNNNEVTGIRLLKYNPRYGEFQGHQVIFRYADAHLMKAEALFRSGGDPLPLINELRVLRNATPLGSITESDILAERGRELYTERWRRNDLIRFGQYTRDWEFKDPSAVNNPDKELFPIPATQLITNPNLEQNPGY
ncbi:RagB/SusD family nutrient uptake outer membrane protein [Arenibacter sp. GZD96]|uniref:RagB/SusD family nutrient uptake outer membrane protein n=1 Tax=Aurantibrevibacter litoralis TaxID=3106030 RepID=UPI002AFF434C|nr:RagB/SusD family nutrient uptake outer membrane protein [Arenibacter sp. GZD-96]MEA1785546.1 RagB/SusD family nutrient uptake outer membrane protein [Arenibacter sp. GZD-96]